MFKVGDVCICKTPYDGTVHVVIRGPGYDCYKWTIELLQGQHNNGGFHKCVDGPIKFETEVGRWVNDHELTLVKASVREPKGFGKFIRSIEAST